MNLKLARILCFGCAALAIAGEIARQKLGWEGGAPLSLISGVVCAAFARMVLWSHLSEQRNLKLGSETLPPIKDVASVLVGGSPIPEEKKRALLKGLAKARRASTCGSISTEIPFQVVDRWGGTWELEAYQEINGRRGFSINRVCYSGPGAEVVAECAGLEGPGKR